MKIKFIQGVPHFIAESEAEFTQLLTYKNKTGGAAVAREALKERRDSGAEPLREYLKTCHFVLKNGQECGKKFPTNSIKIHQAYHNGKTNGRYNHELNKWDSAKTIGNTSENAS